VTSRGPGAFIALWAVYLLAAMHYRVPNVGGGALYLPVNSVAWIFTSLLIGLGLWNITLRAEIVYSRFLAYAAAAAALMAVPYFYPGYPYRKFEIPQLLCIVGGLVFLFSLYQFRDSQRDRWAILYLLLCAVLIEGLLGAIQFSASSAPQVVGVFQQRNVMASFMATGLAVALWLLAHETELTRQRKLLIYGVLLAAPFFLVATHSRTGGFGAGLAITLMLPALWKAGRSRTGSALVVMAVSTGVAFLLLKALHKMPDTIGFRQTLWLYTLKLFLEKPWIGHGLGSFESILRPRYTADRRVDPTMMDIEENLDHPHNETLYWGFEGGLVPVIGIALVAFAYLSLAYRAKPWAGMALLGLVAPIVLHTQTEFPFRVSVAHWLVLIYLVYVADHQAGTLSAVQYPHRFLLRFLAIGIPAVTLPFMATAIQAVKVLTEFELSSVRDRRVLERVINPVPIAWRYTADAYALRLDIGRSFGNREDIQAYIDWSAGFLARTPRAVVYANRVKAFMALGDMEAAEKTRLEGLRLYPGEKRLLEPAAAAGK
jgi:O-antigen polymerase